MNIEINNVKKTNNEVNSVQKNTNTELTENTVSFSEELKELEFVKKNEEILPVKEENEIKTSIENKVLPKEEFQTNNVMKNKEKQAENIIANNLLYNDELEVKNTFEKDTLFQDELQVKIKNEDNIEIEKESDLKLNQAFEKLSSIVQEFNQSDEMTDKKIKENKFSSDNNDMINNDFNIQENKDLLPQMNPNMNFSGDGQPFSSFMNNDEKKDSKVILPSTVEDIAEEKAILSTMEENVAIARKNIIVNSDKKETLKKDEIKSVIGNVEISENKTLEEIEQIKIVNRNDGVKKVDTKTGITVENIIKYDSLVMNKADVEVFMNIVENKSIDMNNLAPKSVEQGVQISKTLADMLAKSMENQQPVRIDFDNDISIIIRISRDGKISAEFLPSSQIAEAYLKENLPLLRQRFESNNIDYESLEQRDRKEQNREHNRKKGRENE